MFTEEIKKMLSDFAEKVDDAYRPYTRDNIVASTMVDDFIENYGKEVEVEEETIPMTFAFLNRKIKWEYLHEIIKVGYYAQKEYGIKDTEIFDIPMSVAKGYDLI